MTLRTAAALLVVLTASACGDGSLISYQPPADGERTAVDGYRLEIVSPQPLVLEPYAVRPFTVRLTHDGRGVSDTDVAFAIDGATGGARLAALRARTSGAGEATVEIVAGGEAADFALLAESAYTPAVRAVVQVVATGEAPGALRVRIAYPSQADQPVQRVAISTYPGTESCQELTGGAPQTALAIRELLDVAAEGLFEALPVESGITVVAVGHNATAAVASGCLEGVPMTGGEETVVTVAMAPRGLSVEGTYDLEERFDMTGAIPGRAGSVITTVAEIFDDGDDPGRYLVDIIESKVGMSFGFLKQTAIDLVNDLIISFVPERFRNLFAYIGDAARVVTNLTAEATLKITRAEDGSLVGTEVWDAVVFSWQAGCANGITPGCDRHRIALRNTRITPVVATYPVTLDNGVLRISAHDRQVEYARFFHLFIQQLVFPHIVPGATTTTEVLRGSINCVAVADWIEGADGSNDGELDLALASVSVDSLEGYCDSALGLAGLLVDSKLDELAASVPSNVTLQGAAVVVDDNRDLVPEFFEQGLFEGGIVLDGVSHPVAGDFIGARRAE